MDNKTLATELITRYAGLPHPMRGMIQEAARRLLQMAPEHEFTVPQEANSLRELAAEWPLTDKPWITTDWTADDWLRCVCNAAADRIEQMAEAIDYGRKLQAERDAMAASLKARGGCSVCKYYYFDCSEEPCDSCRQDGTYPKWEWKGDNHG